MAGRIRISRKLKPHFPRSHTRSPSDTRMARAASSSTQPKCRSSAPDFPEASWTSAWDIGIEMEHTCGGVCACSTCHVMVKQGLASCNEATEDEEDQLEEAPGITIQSRLACQCVPDGSMDVVVEIPAWNRNAVKETPH